MKDERIYLVHIRDYIEELEDFTQDGRAAFMQTRMIQAATLHNFTIIGEAVKRLSPALRARYAMVPWQEIAGFRDVVVHDYMDVDLEQVWRILEQDVPPLKQAITTLLNELGEPEE